MKLSASPPPYMTKQETIETLKEIGRVVGPATPRLRTLTLPDGEYALVLDGVPAGTTFEAPADIPCLVFPFEVQLEESARPSEEVLSAVAKVVADAAADEEQITRFRSALLSSSAGQEAAESERDELRLELGQTQFECDLLGEKLKAVRKLAEDSRAVGALVDPRRILPVLDGLK